MVKKERSNMIMMVVPTQISPERNESPLWLLFPFSD